MPNRDDRTSGRWNLTTRPLGEVLAAQVDHRGLSLAAFIASGSRTPREVEGRLLDIVDGAAVAANGDIGPRPVPALVYHALDGLLRWRDELARHGEGEPFHAFAAFASEDGMISVANVSGGTPEVELDGAPYDAPWLSALRRGEREVPAFSIYAGRRDRVRVVWTGGAGRPGAAGASVEAEWRREAPVAAERAVSALEEARPGLLPDPSRTGADETSVAEPPADAAPAAIETGPPAVLGIASESTMPAAAWGLRRGPAVLPGTGLPASDRAAGPDVGAAPGSAAVGSVQVEVAPGEDAPGVTGSDAPPDTEMEFPFVMDDEPPPADERDVPFAMEETVVVIEDEPPAVVAPGAPPEAAAAGGVSDAATPVEAAEPMTVEDAPRPIAIVERTATEDATAIEETIAMDEPDAAGAAIATESAAAIEPAAADATGPAVETELDSGADADTVTAGAPAPRFAPLRPEWPSEQELERPRRLRRILPWALAVVVLFAIGWFVGTAGQNERGTRSAWTRALRAVGLGGAWFDATITSRPPGAWITVDGQETARRTPATIELKPGTHRITLALDGLGEATYEVRGAQGERVPLETSLLGSLVVRSTDPEVPIEVSVDGVGRGYAPTVVTGLEPGPHTVEFSGPGMTPWGTTVEVRIGEEAEALARPFESPATGVIEVQAFIPGDSGPVEVDGAAVRVDGRPAGVTPITLELDRGPHSVVVTHGSVTAPVQLIDLPGGNQRYARFSFGSGGPAPRLTFITGTGPIPGGRPFPVSASLDGVSPRDVREMWLHVGSQDGAWRRYPMAMLEAAGAVVGTVVFPSAALDAKGYAPFYASTLTSTGDEYFTELQNAPAPVAGKRPSTRSTGARTR